MIERRASHGLLPALLPTLLCVTAAPAQRTGTEFPELPSARDVDGLRKLGEQTVTIADKTQQGLLGWRLTETHRGTRDGKTVYRQHIEGDRALLDEGRVQTYAIAALYDENLFLIEAVVRRSDGREEVTTTWTWNEDDKNLVRAVGRDDEELEVSARPHAPLDTVVRAVGHEGITKDRKREFAVLDFLEGTVSTVTYTDEGMGKTRQEGKEIEFFAYQVEGNASGRLIYDKSGDVLRHEFSTPPLLVLPALDHPVTLRRAVPENPALRPVILEKAREAWEEKDSRTWVNEELGLQLKLTSGSYKIPGNGVPASLTLAFVHQVDGTEMQVAVEPVGNGYDAEAYAKRVEEMYGKIEGAKDVKSKKTRIGRDEAYEIEFFTEGARDDLVLTSLVTVREGLGLRFLIAVKAEDARKQAGEIKKLFKGIRFTRK